MTQADRIRQFALEYFIVPARTANQKEVAFRVGDIHKSMGLRNAMPAVCSAVGSSKFERLAQVTQIDRAGPTNGSNVFLNFRLDPPPTLPNSVVLATARVFESQPKLKAPAANLEPRNALVLVSCVKSKGPHAVPARELYTSAWFTKARDLVETSGARWYVLSSLYRLISPETVIEPYDYTLNTLGVRERKIWAKQVLEQLEPQLDGIQRIVMFAGQRYREFLIQPLERLGITVEVPMEHLNRGQQLAWLTEFE